MSQKTKLSSCLTWTEPSDSALQVPKPKLIRADFSAFVGDVEVQVQGEFSPAEPDVGWPAGYEISRVWIETDLNATDLQTLLTDKQIDAIQEAGVRWGSQR